MHPGFAVALLQDQNSGALVFMSVALAVLTSAPMMCCRAAHTKGDIGSAPVSTLLCQGGDRRFDKGGHAVSFMKPKGGHCCGRADRQEDLAAAALERRGGGNAARRHGCRPVGASVDAAC